VSARLKVAVLISGRGSNLQALIDACRPRGFPAEIVSVISNVPGAFGLERAAKAKIPASVVAHSDFPNREAFEDALGAALKKSGAEFICLAGFMRMLGPAFIGTWEGRIVNIHPSLLPAFKGLHVHEQVLKARVPVSGCTVHFVTPELDGGPTIAQAAVKVLADDTPDTLAARILEAEHRLYPLALRKIALGDVKLENGRTVFGVKRQNYL